MIKKILIWLYLSVAMGVFFAVTIFGTVAILQTIFGQEIKMRDPSYWREVEREEAEKSDEKDRIWTENQKFSTEIKEHKSLWRKRQIEDKDE